MRADRVRFVKMSGAGNDFVVIDADAAERLGDDLATWIRRVCRRGLSIGGDGVLIVEPAGPDRVRVRFHNPDASVAFCGNGSRCAARFAVVRGLAGPRLELDTAAGPVPAEVEGDRVRLKMPPPEDRGPVGLDLGGERVEGRAITSGVPHFVVTLAELRGSELVRWGPQVRRHPAFGSAGTNLDVVAPLGGGVWAIRTWERGVEGETLSCGSGAVAAAFAARLAGGPASVRIVPASGVALDVRFDGPPDRPSATWFEGDARLVAEGHLTAEAVTGFDA